ncbi:MAG: zinc-ribbon domain-containing protein [Verrucomicrobia bacterium]|nr:zinc-ribbon domain-containing protein [Deltaproteobacteria bacterium]
MIIQCEQCQTKFKLDDSKVPDKGVKVRCAKCRHVFSVVREQAEAEPLDGFVSMLDSSVLSGRDAAEVQPEFSAPDQGSEIEFEDTAPFSPEEAGTLTPVQVEPQDPSDEIDFGAFAFGDDNDDTVAATPLILDFGDSPKIQPLPVESKKEEFRGLDFSGDDLFGEVVPSTPDESAGAISFDFGMDDFAASMGVDDSAASQKNAFTTTESSSYAPFSLDEIDFGDELTSVGVQHVNPEELKPSQELLFAPLAEAQAKPVPDADHSDLWKSPAPKEELPPLSIASRRKQSPLFTGLVAVLGIAIVGVIAFFGYSMFAGGKAGTVQETGRISVRAVDAAFVKNKLTGDLLVISGEAVNEFNKPRAAIQIKGMVYGVDGEVVASKNAFCGNPLTEEQLSTMSMENIEAAMANQFGDSLANMEVAPGKAIPFVIVIATPPAGSKDYGVEPAGSTLATDKQQ